jgi:hypothetical protein
MADLFTLSGGYGTRPLAGSSGFPSIDTPLLEQVQLDREATQKLTLTTDSPVAVDFCGLTEAHVVVVKATGSKVRVRLTSADGSAQAIPVDSFLAIIAQAVPFTAMDVTRLAGGVETEVRIFLGETP